MTDDQQFSDRTFLEVRTCSRCAKPTMKVFVMNDEDDEENEEDDEAEQTLFFLWSSCGESFSGDA